MPNSSLSICLLEPNIIWENKAANFAQYDAILQQLSISAPHTAIDVLIFPEMFATGFSMNVSQLAEPTEGPTLTWMRHWAQQLDCAVTGSCIIEDSDTGKHYNRAFWVEPNGSYTFYDKRHLFRMGGEHDIYTSGNKQLCVEWRNWRIGLLVCYDLRFPIWARRHAGFDYDCLIYMANWPTARIFAWSQLLVARAIENQAYVVGVNRVGNDGQQIAHNGNSVVINYLGETIFTTGDTHHNHKTYAPTPAQTSLHTIRLSRESMSDFRQNFPAWADADNFTLEL